MEEKEERTIRKKGLYIAILLWIMVLANSDILQCEISLNRQSLNQEVVYLKSIYPD